MTKKPKPKTPTTRQRNYLGKLAEAKGKRLPVDLDAERVGKLNGLIEAEYGTSQVDAIRHAIDDAHKKIMRKKT